MFFHNLHNLFLEYIKIKMIAFNLSSENKLIFLCKAESQE